jgi:hypothetical protein
VNPVPLAHKYQRDALGHYGAAIALNRDLVLKIGHAPGFREERRDKEEKTDNQFVET